MTVLGDEPLVPVAEAVDVRDAVVVMQLHHNGPDDVVDSRTQPAAGDDPRARLGGVEVDLCTRSGLLKTVLQVICIVRISSFVQDPGLVGHKVKLGVVPIPAQRQR